MRFIHSMLLDIEINPGDRDAMIGTLLITKYKKTGLKKYQTLALSYFRKAHNYCGIVGLDSRKGEALILAHNLEDERCGRLFHPQAILEIPLFDDIIVASRRFCEKLRDLEYKAYKNYINSHG